MDAKNEARDNWINPLLSELDLVQADTRLVDYRTYWTQLEECRLPERIRKVVAEVNGAAGYHVLELLDFLPPQRTILRVKFTKHETEHILEVVLREHGLAVCFYSLRKFSLNWRGLFSNHSRTRNRTNVLEQNIQPAEILDDNIQAWFSYLLSGLEKKFKPNGKQRLSENSSLHVNAAVEKVSA
jgi:hypothetical protein